MNNIELLKELCLCNSVSGDENAVREIILREIKDFCDNIFVDPLGNIIAHKKGKNRAKSKLMLSAHMDEVGLMVTDITNDGYLKFDEVGGIDRRVIVGKRVSVGTNKLQGIVGIKPIHLTKSDERLAIGQMSEMYIDIGAKSKQEALKYVSYGDSIYFNADFYTVNSYLHTKAVDDRFGCFVLIQLIKSELEYDTDFVFCVQEEVGLRGSKTAAYTVDPEFAIVVETTTAADIPNIEKQKQVCNLGDGAVISIMDRRTIYDKEMVKLAFDCAEKNGIKLQYKRAVAGGNDAGSINVSRGGVRTLAVSLACRYLHAPICACSLDDCDSVLEIVKILSEKIAGGSLSAKEIVK